MELRAAEKEVDGLRELYESIRLWYNNEDKSRIVNDDDNADTTNLQHMFPALMSRPSPKDGRGNENNNNDSIGNGKTNDGGGDATSTTTKISSAKDAYEGMMNILDCTKDETTTATASASSSLLASKMGRFQKRLNERDPITDKPRYGAKTMDRVRALLEKYHELKTIVAPLDDDFVKDVKGESGGDPSNMQEDNVDSIRRSNSDPVSVVLGRIREHAEREKDEALQRQRDEIRRLEEAEVRRIEQQRDEEQRQLQREQDEERRIQQQREEIRLEAERVRLEETRARREAERLDRRWVDGITKGIDGVQEQLRRLVQCTTADDRRTAIEALHVLFTQIVRHPEEVNYRRIRRDHPRFMNDIGRHDGGKEILIASGFRLGSVDDVPSYVCHEPNIETDMDAWSEWFDLLKKTLELIQSER